MRCFIKGSRLKLNFKNLEKRKDNSTHEINIKKDLLEVLSFLQEQYINNPEKFFSATELSQQTNKPKHMIYDIIYILNKKLMLIKSGKNEYRISFEGVLYLEDILEDIKQFKLNKMAIIISLGAFSITALNIFDDPGIKIISLLLTFIIIWAVDKVMRQK